MQILREYQVEAVTDTRQSIREGFKRILLVMPTGSGKTTVACHIIHNAVNLGHEVIFLAHRKELIDQCSARLDEHGVDHGIIKAGNKRMAPHLPVQVASVMTLVRRKRNRPKCKIFFIDEAHRAMAKSYLVVLESYPEAVVIGLSATPFRLDGRGLGHIFTKIVECSSPYELTKLGFLVKARVFSTPVMPSISGIKKKMGDYDNKALESSVNRNNIVGNIVEHWIKYAKDRLTVCFCVSRIHASRVMEEFLSNGISADYVDGETKESVREDKLDKFGSGKTLVMCNVGILTEGWDVPAVSCVILARPTQSVALYLQMAGRALRPAPWVNKTDCIILDHGGNTMVHGFVTDERQYDLDGIDVKSKSESEKIVKTCEDCFCVYSGTLCPECGHKNKTTKRSDVKEVNGHLVEIDPEAKFLEQKRFLHQMLREQFTKTYKESYAASRFKAKYNVWPGKRFGVKPRFRYDIEKRKTIVDGFDYSKAFKEAGIHVSFGKESTNSYLAKVG